MEKITPQYFLSASHLVLGYPRSVPITQKPFSFNIPSGSVTALVGLNGSGKSTLINGLVGGHGIIQGAVNSYGVNLRQISNRHLPQLMSVVPQDIIYPIHLRVRDFLELAFLPRVGLLGALPSITSEPFQSILKQLDVIRILDRQLNRLSAGEKQRASLARAILQKSRMMILDEPTSHLDIRASKNFWQTLLAAKKLNQTDVLLSTHDFDFVKTHCAWVLALKEGELFFSGTSSDFFDQQMDELLIL